MMPTAKDALIETADRFAAKTDPRSIALSKTLRELAEDLAGYAPGDVAQAYAILAKAYVDAPPFDPAWAARAATVAEIAADLNPVVDRESTSAIALWDDLIRGVERRRGGAPEDARARLDAMLFTMRYERRLLGEAAGEGDAGPYPKRPGGGFTPRSGPTSPAPATFSG
jgi:hypothetical protein